MSSCVAAPARQGWSGHPVQCQAPAALVGICTCLTSAADNLPAPLSCRFESHPPAETRLAFCLQACMRRDATLMWRNRVVYFYRCAQLVRAFVFLLFCCPLNMLCFLCSFCSC